MTEEEQGTINAREPRTWFQRNATWLFGALAVVLVVVVVVVIALGAMPDDNAPDKYEAPFYVETMLGNYYVVGYQITDGVLVVQKWTDKMMDGVMVVVEGPYNINYRLPENMIPKQTPAPESGS